MPLPDSIDAMLAMLADQKYVADRNLAATVFLALELDRPILLEGEPGVGKTELAKALARILDRHLIRLRCHQALDVSSAVYEWNYARQMIELRIAELAHEADPDILTDKVFSEQFLDRGPILEAFSPEFEGPPVLLIEGIDRADEAFEVFLLDVLSTHQVTVPEIGTIKPKRPPIIVITSNHQREILAPLKRRCFYHAIDYPNRRRELEILQTRCPELPDDLADEAVAFVEALREDELFEPPGVGETLDWANALLRLDRTTLDPDTVDETLGILLKFRDDLLRIRGNEVRRILASL